MVRKANLSNVYNEILRVIFFFIFYLRVRVYVCTAIYKTNV